MTGRNNADARRANIAAGHPEWNLDMPDGWSWHHVEDKRTMELIPFEINKKFKHEGEASKARRAEQ
jgi:hypothetical protein